MTRGSRALAVGSATLGTGLLAGAFVLMTRAGAPGWAMLLWGAVALVSVAAFLGRFRAQRVSEAVALSVLVAVGQTVALHAVLLLLRGPGPTAGGVLRHLLGFAVLDLVTLVTATLAGHWFPQRPPSR